MMEIELAKFALLAFALVAALCVVTVGIQNDGGPDASPIHRVIVNSEARAAVRVPADIDGKLQVPLLGFP